MPAGEVGEFVAGSGRHEHVSAVRVAQSRVRTREAVRIVAERVEPLASVATSDELAVLEEEHGLRSGVAVEPLGELARAPAAKVVDHAGPVRRRDDELVDAGEGMVQGRRAVDTSLSVVRADDDRVALQQRVHATRGVEQRAHRVVCTRERDVSRVRAGRV